MHLIKLTITNLGVYAGENTFNLATNGGNIILFGGKNGSGKTTILNSIRLCLYGSKALGQKKSKKEYEEFIDKQIHRSKYAKVPINSASVELVFEYGELSSFDTYSINRSWVRANGNGKIKEQLYIKKNNQMLFGIEEKHWQSFLEDLIPLNIFNLFFFDGEKITDLMIGNLSPSTLDSEIKKMLGLDLIEQLQADLDIYLYQQRKKHLNEEEIKKFDALEKARDDTEKIIISTKQKKANIVSNINYVLGEIEDLELKINRESSGYALDRRRWQERLTQIEVEKNQLKKEYIDLSANLLPFSLIPNLLIETRNQLVLETNYQNWMASLDSLKPKIRNINETILKEEFWDGIGILDNQKRILIIKKLSESLEELFQEPEEYENFKVRQELSNNEKTKIYNWIDQALSNLPDQSANIINTFSALDEEQRSVAIKLRKIPSDEILKPYVDKLNSLYQKLGNLEGQKAQIEENIRVLENKYSESKSLILKVFNALRTEENLETRLQLVRKSQKVLEEFLNKQKKMKLHALEELLVARFRELIRKENFIFNAEIDEFDLNITLFDSQQNVIPNEQLSAGEQQMFAIALIWALRQLSGRPYPVVIDTPLGRLDSDHRSNLISQYFPLVSHQVILLSTDTEVDKNYFKELQPFTSHSYHLNYDSDQDATNVETGYFWSKEISHAIDKN